MKTVWTTVRRVFADFCKARQGNVAITFALAAVPILGFVGAAYDYSHANAVKASLQAALDSSSLMLPRDAASLSQDDLKTKALNYVNALINRPEALSVTITKAEYTTTGGSTINLEASADVATTFFRILKVAGFPEYDYINVKGSSSSKWGSSRLRVALVLDNTGSMLKDGKIGALKTATANLLTQLQNAVSTPGDVYVSIVPFVKDVKIDPTNYITAWDNWIYWDDAAKSDNNSWDANNGTCSPPFSSYSPPERMSREVVLLAIELHDPEQLHRRGRLLGIEQNERDQLYKRGHLLESRSNRSKQLHGHESLLQVAVHVE